MRPPLSVVVPTRDRPALLAACLASLAAVLHDGDEVVVADSASTDRDAVAQVAAEAGVTLVRCERAGVSLARNTGWRATCHELVVFVDDDVHVQPGWDAALVAAGGDFAVSRTIAPEGVAGDVASVTHGAPPEGIDLSTPGVLAATNPLLVKRAALHATGGFDERLGPGTWFQAGEDVELIDRLLSAGFAGRYAADAVAVHEQWRGAADRRRLQYAYGKGMGARTASVAHRDRRRALGMLGEVVRLGGVRTAVVRLVPWARPQAGPNVGSGSSGHSRSKELLGPLLWRIGAVVGLVAGLRRLRPSDARAPAPLQVPVDD